MNMGSDWHLYAERKQRHREGNGQVKTGRGWRGALGRREKPRPTGGPPRARGEERFFPSLQRDLPSAWPC